MVKVEKGLLQYPGDFGSYFILCMDVIGKWSKNHDYVILKRWEKFKILFGWSTNYLSIMGDKGQFIFCNLKGLMSHASIDVDLVLQAFKKKR